MIDEDLNSSPHTADFRVEQATNSTSQQMLITKKPLPKLPAAF